MVSQHLLTQLNERENHGNPIRVAVAGTGFIGRGLINQISLMKGIKVCAVANRSIDKAVTVIKSMGSKIEYKMCNNKFDMQIALRDAAIGVTTNPLLLAEADVDVVVDCTGDTELGAELGLSAIENKKHFIANAEMDVTVGPVLNKMAKNVGVVYSGAEGDEPGVIMSLYRYIKMLGLEIIAAGKFKGYYDCHATPISVKPWADKAEQSPIKICSFTDGSKMSIEMALVANATGLLPDIRGMHLPQGTLDTITSILRRKEEGGILSSHGAIEIVKGVEPSGGVYIVASTPNTRIQKDLKYYKMGDGPNYLFYRPYHLCSFEMAIGVAKAVIDKDSTIAPLGKPIADVVTIAKKDLNAGEILDDIGGYTYYGLIDKAETIKEENILPVGLARGARLKNSVIRDKPITLSDVEIDEGSVLWKLRKLHNEMI